MFCLLWLIERPWTVVREGMITSHGIFPVICLLSFILFIVACVVLSCVMGKFRHLLTIVQSESMKPALRRGDILISFPIQLDDSQLTARDSGNELLEKGDIILFEASI